jgi:hypothetical protein
MIVMNFRKKLLKFYYILSKTCDFFSKVYKISLKFELILSNFYKK